MKAVIIGTVSKNYFANTKIAVFSDLHIGVHQNSRFWHNITKDWAEWIIADLKQHNIQDIVFCGDYFHTRDEISVDTLHFGSRLLELFKDFNITMITGNHDCYLRDSSDINSLAPYAQWSNINLVDSTQIVESHGRKFSFVPWGEKIQNIQKSDIIFGHFEINFFKMNTFFICDHGVDADVILKKSPLIVSGHFHLRDERKYTDGTVLYVGNPFQMDFNDAGTNKGYYIMDVVENTYVFYENKISPTHHNITLSSMVQSGTITSEVKDQIRNNLIKLKIDRRISPDDVDVLLVKMRQYAPLQFVVEYETNFSDYDLDGDRKDLSGIDIEQAMREFIDLMDINNRQEVIDYTLELYKKIRK